MPSTGSAPYSAARSLFDLAAATLTRDGVFAPSPDQCAVLGHVRQLLATTQPAASNQATVIVTGATGTGKSALALTLLGEGLRAGHRTCHATGSQAFTTALRKTAGRGSRATQQLFQYFGTIADAAPDGLDLLICDDTHQLRSTSNTRFTPASRRSDRSQAAELLAAARVVVFLLDEDQAVRPGQIGTRSYLETVAGAHGATVDHFDLDTQHRCRAAHYDGWVRSVLGLGGPAPSPQGRWQPGDAAFEVVVAETPDELVQWLEAKSQQGASTRITAGYCWPWSDATPGNPLVDDVVVGDWRRPWCVKGTRAVNGQPPSPLWAIDPAGVGQIGCIYAAQGVEYDYGGVILGPDILRRGNRWVTDAAATRDDALVVAPAADVDQWIRRTYRVLLTRGRAGTVLYATDPETRAYLRDLVYS